MFNFIKILLFSPTLLSFSWAAVLVDFQVAQPPSVPLDAKQCTLEILQRDFAFSFGSAEVVQFVPPSDCGLLGSWAAITLNFTVTSNGTQFDRLGIFTFQNVEIWRTSTPEPTRGDGIIWTYIKDVTRYTPLFAKPGTFILQLDNLIETGLDGIYSTTLHATFYASSAKHPPAKQANVIIPLSSLSNTTGNDASVPPGFSINVTIPQNSVQVYAELYASGNGQEESWYFNAANEFFPSIPAGITFGQGPFREVRLLIDGKVAGVAFPYAVIFTGGFIPSAWRPITAYGAIDLPTYFLDLTAFVPLLADGQSHNFTLDVASAEADHTILQNWFLSGLLQIITDPLSNKRTTGKITTYTAEPYALSTTTGSVSANGDVDITVTATRKIYVEADVISPSGQFTNVIWSQDLEYSNTQNWLNDAFVQNLRQTASGTVFSTHNGVPSVTDIFSYPLNINFTFLTSDEQSFNASFDHSYERLSLPGPFMVGSTINERQMSGGFFQLAPTGNFGNGTSNNSFSYVDLAGNTYSRKVDAAFNNITLDRQSGNLVAPMINHGKSSSVSDETLFAAARIAGGRNV